MSDIKQIKVMKKHKVKIPEGYEVGSTTTYSYTNINDNKICTSVELHLKPIKKQLPKTWEEYFESEDVQSRHDIIVTSRYSNELEALGQLVELRDHYNDGWEPNWTSDYDKFVIYIDRNSITKACITNGSHVLRFKNPDLRDKFLSNFRDLIETAKPLL